MRRRWKLPEPPHAVLAYLLAGSILLAGGVSFVLVPILRTPAPAAPLILIQEPRAWAGAWRGAGPAPATAGVVVVSGRSVEIQGVAQHTSPIAEVRIGARRLGATFAPDRRTVEFSGFFDAADLRADASVELEVRTVGGESAVRRLPVRVEAAGDAGPSLDEVYGRDRHQRWAVIIGIDAFDDDRIEPLPGAGADAAAIAAALRSPAAGLGGLPADHVRTLTGEEATARNVRSALKTFLRGATPGDLVLVHIAGRAFPDPHRPGRWYLAVRDTELDDLPATALDVRVIAEAVEEVFGRTRVVLVDLVQEGGALGEVAGPLVTGTVPRQGGLAMLAVPGMGAAGSGAVAAALLDGLGGEADRDGDGTIRVGELMDHIGARLPAADDPTAPRLSAAAYDRSWPVAALEADGGT